MKNVFSFQMALFIALPENVARKKKQMQTLLPVFILIVVIAFLGYLLYRDAARKRKQAKKRNHYNDRV